MAVRSRLLAHTRSLQGSTWVDVVAPAAGRTAIIRHWSLHNGSTGAQEVRLGVRRGTLTLNIARNDSLGAGATLQEPRANLVVAEGEALAVWVPGSGSVTAIQVVVCGSLLDGPPE